MSIGAIRDRTEHFEFIYPNFNFPSWHSYIDKNFALIDALLYLITGISDLRGIWENSTAYVVGDRAVDEDTSVVYQCLVGHTSSASGTFAAHRSANPTHWQESTITPEFRGTWATATAYNNNDFVVRNNVYYVCVEAHTSGVFATDLTAVKWVALVDITAQVTAAETAETNAETAATAAAASATAAAASETSAASDAAAAAASETAAETAATNAATSETNAAASAAAAQTAETNAETAKTNAETAETNAGTAATNAAASATEAAAQAAKLTGTSTSSVAIGTGSKAFTTQSSKFFDVGNFVLIVDDAAPATNWMFGQVTAYSGTSLTVNVVVVGGSGTKSAWTIRVAGARGATGDTGPAGTIADGDKGNITVSSSGTVWTIDNDVVTYAKMQNVSATQRAIGRNTSGAGDPEEVTASQLIDWVGSTRGAILYRGAAGWAILAPGTSGHFLKSNGAGADPSYAAVSSPTASTTAQVETGSDTTTFVSPGTMRYHLSHPKATARFSVAGVLSFNSGVSFITDVGTGSWTATLLDTFATASLGACVVSALTSTTLCFSVTAQTTTTFSINAMNTSGTLTDPSSAMYFIIMGDIA